MAEHKSPILLLQYTCKHVSLQGLKALLYTSEGDLRKAITFLQSASRLKPEDTITQADIFEIAGVGNFSIRRQSEERLSYGRSPCGVVVKPFAL